MSAYLTPYFSLELPPNRKIISFLNVAHCINLKADITLSTGSKIQMPFPVPEGISLTVLPDWGHLTCVRLQLNHIPTIRTNQEGITQRKPLLLRYNLPIQPDKETIIIASINSFEQVLGLLTRN